MRYISAYLFLTHGPKHTASVQHLPGAQRQLGLLKEAASNRGATVDLLGHDYPNRLRSREDLQELFRLLTAYKALSSQKDRPSAFFMDDYSRLFRAAEQGFRLELWAELMEYSDHLVDLRHGKPLHALSPELSLVIKSGALKPWTLGFAQDTRPLEDKAAQTLPARAISKLLRKSRASAATQSLRDAWAEYNADNPKATKKAFMESDAGKALLNSQGKPWSYKSAVNVLRGIPDETLSQKQDTFEDA